MNKPTEEQIREVLAGTSTPETARLVAQWFATDEGTDYLSRSMDCDVEQVKLGYEELYVDHEIASDELFARIRRNIRRKRVRRIVFRVAAVLIPFVGQAGGLVWRLRLRRNLCGEGRASANDVSGRYARIYQFGFPLEVSQEVCSFQS